MLDSFSPYKHHIGLNAALSDTLAQKLVIILKSVSENWLL